MPEGQKRPGKSFKQLKVLFHWAPEKDKTKICPPCPLEEGALVFMSGKRKSMSCSESAAIPLPTRTHRARDRGWESIPLLILKRRPFAAAQGPGGYNPAAQKRLLIWLPGSLLEPESFGPLPQAMPYCPWAMCLLALMGRSTKGNTSTLPTHWLSSLSAPLGFSAYVHFLWPELTDF